MSIGGRDTSIKSTPKDINIVNKTHSVQLIIVTRKKDIIAGNLIYPHSKLVFPSIENSEYEIKVLGEKMGNYYTTQNIITRMMISLFLILKMKM